MSQTAAPDQEFFLRQYLNERAQRYEQESFIAADPISVAYRFTDRADIEIAAFIAASFAWGQRTTIINKANELLALMDNAPAEFIRQHTARDRKRFEHFVHRTFQPTDAKYFVRRLQAHYREHDSLESLFTAGMQPDDADVSGALIHFHEQFFNLADAPQRTRKHVATPARKSSCKRLNMFLRWMVRPATAGVDFGLWQTIQPRQLLIPLDVHVQRVARRLGLLDRKQSDWQAVLELTERLRAFDADDPVKYDFALFGEGVLEKNDDLTSI